MGKQYRDAGTGKYVKKNMLINTQKLLLVKPIENRLINLKRDSKRNPFACKQDLTLVIES